VEQPRLAGHRLGAEARAGEPVEQQHADVVAAAHLAGEGPDVLDEHGIGDLALAAGERQDHPLVRAEGLTDLLVRLEHLGPGGQQLQVVDPDPQLPHAPGRDHHQAGQGEQAQNEERPGFGTHGAQNTSAWVPGPEGRIPA
jgi:hypothetical protein